ncbi:Na(+)/H(+) exchanger beta-like isoform X2 [Ruditapes philippinarum]|uniref:Na(+)/H(+) exchanger beta-like isoform X2 n=1 Tax=Ruditapes philippinarum TaxID=129788 RepID=UPI00295B4747|nr:Na(+)/H(+) exchanger beta-like isoform X2 [Ruditapes philippinarum]
MGLKLKYRILIGFAIIVCIHSNVVKPSHFLDDHGYNVDIAKRSTHTKGAEADPTGANHTNETNGTESHVKHVHHSMHVASWQFERVKSPFIISVFLIAAGIAKLGFHHANFLSSKVPESCLLIILGTMVGAVLYLTLPHDEENQPSMDSELFFLYLLPPIILESAYSLHDRTFYDNVGTVMIYAVLGTVLNCFLIGPSLYGIYKIGWMGNTSFEINFVQTLVFSAVIVAVDPVAVLAIFQEIGVNNTLYFLVFGESLFNDAVTVVLYNMMKTLNLMDEITFDQVLIGVLQFFVVSIGGLIVGVIWGAITAILTKFTEHCRVVEPLAVFVLAYISYLMAEMFHFSGIISIIGCGLTQAQYAFHNISRKSHTTVKYFSKMMSSTCDCVIFLFLGISLFKKDVLTPEHWNIGFIGWTVLFCLLYRFLVVFALTFVFNRGNRMRKIDLEEQFIMAYGGLRGAVAFSLVGVLHKDNLPKGIFLTTTIVVIFFTVFVQGGTIKPLVKLLRVKMEDSQKLQLYEEISSHVTDHVMAGIEEITGQRGEHYIREMLEYYNSKYLKYWLQRNPVSQDEKIMQYFEKLALEQHFEQLAGCKMIIEKYGSETDLTEDIELEEEEEREKESETGSIADDISINIGSIQSSCEDIESELDDELIRRQAITRRRRAILPVPLTKDLESRLNDNPTAQDIRKIMLPVRQKLNYRKLDINLTHDDSENDLLRYLQSKQMKTRRVSQALWNQAPSATPEIPEAGRARRKSVAPVAVNNYRRRLSLAVPDPFSEGARRRGKSTGNALKGLDSPARRRLRFKRGAHSLASDDLSDSQNLFPLTESIREDDELNSECDKMSESEHNKTDDKSTTKEDTSKGALQSVINSKSKHGSLKRSKTEDAKGSPSAGVRKGGSFKGQNNSLHESQKSAKSDDTDDILSVRL